MRVLNRCTEGERTLTIDVSFHPKVIEFTRTNSAYHRMVSEVAIDETTKALNRLMGGSGGTDAGKLKPSLNSKFGFCFFFVQSNNPMNVYPGNKYSLGPSYKALKNMKCKGERPAVLNLGKKDASESRKDMSVRENGGKASQEPDKQSSNENSKNSSRNREAASEKYGPIKPSVKLVHRGKVELSEHMTGGVPYNLDEDNEGARDTTISMGPSTCPSTLVAHIHLPTLSSAADIELDVGEKSIHLRKGEEYELSDYQLPYPVDTESVQAKFDKKKKQLSITMPVDRKKVESKLKEQAKHMFPATTETSSEQTTTTHCARDNSEANSDDNQVFESSKIAENDEEDQCETVSKEVPCTLSDDLREQLKQAARQPKEQPDHAIKTAEEQEFPIPVIWNQTISELTLLLQLPRVISSSVKVSIGDANQVFIRCRSCTLPNSLYSQLNQAGSPDNMLLTNMDTLTQQNPDSFPYGIDINLNGSVKPEPLSIHTLDLNTVIVLAKEGKSQTIWNTVGCVCDEKNLIERFCSNGTTTFAAPMGGSPGSTEGNGSGKNQLNQSAISDDDRENEQPKQHSANQNREDKQSMQHSAKQTKKREKSFHTSSSRDVVFGID